MLINTGKLVPMAEANRNFSKVVHLLDEEGPIVIMKNNKPRYVVINFKEYSDIQTERESRQDCEKEDNRYAIE